MVKKETKDRLRLHFSAAPPPEESAIHTTIQVLTREAMRAQRAQKTGASKPSFAHLIAAQIRTTKGAVWFFQACVILLLLFVVLQTGNLSTVFAAFSAAAAVLSGISIAGLAFGRGTKIIEINYACYFDYRQVVIARMIAYGCGDLLALLLLGFLGSSFLPLGFIDIALCTGTSFFITSFICLFLFSKYQGDAVLVLCGTSSFLIAALTASLWSLNSQLIQNLLLDFWPLIILAASVGIFLCARSILKKIKAGIDTMEAHTF